jgi:hypothetical protein
VATLLTANGEDSKTVQELLRQADPQRVLRHARAPTANIYMQPIPASVAAAINSCTRTIFSSREQKTAKVPNTTLGDPLCANIAETFSHL